MRIYAFTEICQGQGNHDHSQRSKVNPSTGRSTRVSFQVLYLASGTGVQIDTTQINTVQDKKGSFEASKIH